MLFTANIGNHHFPRCLELLSNVILHPAFDPVEFEEVKQQINYEYENITEDQLLPGSDVQHTFCF
jgi:predicted Zn-dependent peptidase